MTTAKARLSVDDLVPVEAMVAYGALGTHGELGYEGGRVRVRGRAYQHALSAHGPSRLIFDLGGAFGGFHAAVALNDDVTGRRTHAHFLVRADDHLVAQAAHVVPGDPPRALAADLRGAQTLELLVLTARFEYCHAVWLQPRLSNKPGSPLTAQVCALARTRIVLPTPPPRARRCIATAVSPGFSEHVDDLLGSVVANACCGDALLAVFAVNPDHECLRVAAKYGAVVVRCKPRTPINATVKSVLYTAAHAIDADEFVCLDGDMLALDDLRPLFAALSVHPEGSVLVCREGNRPRYANLAEALTSVYGGRPSDIERIGGGPKDGSYELVVNDGMYAARREAMLALDGVIRRWRRAPAWVNERPDISWRNQFVFNLALASSGCGVEIDPPYNIQLNDQEATLAWREGRISAHWQGRAARILHFNGLGRPKYPEWRGHFAEPAEPLAGRGGGDGFEGFQRALRAWVGRHGLSALAWSFYGTADAASARVPDPEALPLFAAVHHLVRANGCVRAIETGSGRGVSAALLASAVAHRKGARVVTLDPNVFAERDELWAALPPEQRSVIEARQVDSVTGLGAALDAGERYEVALLDSKHTAEHVWAELELARRLVCPGGLILVHDPCLPHGNVEGALRRAQRAGYGVVRLWTAETGVAEDDGLGIAVIESRPGVDGRNEEEEER
jgi:predicted O-methyltransferase YrrM